MKGGIIKKTFCIKGEFYKNHTFPGLNEYIAQLGRHPKAGNRMKQEMMMVAINAIQTQLGKWKTEKVHSCPSDPGSDRRCRRGNRDHLCRQTQRQAQ